MEKVFRDSVHNLLGFDRDQDRIILDLIETREVRRLRSIKLMGVSYVVYPGADHNRFSHSLGAAFLMKRIIEKMQGLRNEPFYTDTIELLNEHREILLSAALLHDIGHFPFSHLLESHTQTDHETWTATVIGSPQSEVHQVLKSHHRAYPKQVREIIERTFKPSFGVKFISSQLDVDRMDYLLRDSVHTGVGYGKFDLDWLIHSLRIVPNADDYEIAVDLEKGVRAVESYLIARYHMFQQVYHHKTGRAAGVMVLQILKRASELLDEGGEIFSTPALRKLLVAPSELSLEEFQELDDVVLSYAMRAWRKSSDPVLSDLCHRFLSRELFKTRRVTSEEVERLMRALATECDKLGLDPAYYLHFDRSVSDPYISRHYLGHENEASENIYLVDRQNKLIELAEYSELIKILSNRVSASDRICFPVELRAQFDSLQDLNN